MAIAATQKRGVTGWRLFAILAALAFSFQSYIAQTHIHDAAPASAASAIAKTDHHNKSPLRNTPVECPFCQAVAQAGTVFMPVAPLLFLSEQWIAMAAPHFVLSDSKIAATQGWQSRAPPHP